MKTKPTVRAPMNAVKLTQSTVKCLLSGLSYVPAFRGFILQQIQGDGLKECSKAHTNHGDRLLRVLLIWNKTHGDGQIEFDRPWI
jgi:hypothetical protein